MRVAAFQAPLKTMSTFETVEMIRRQVMRCGAEGISMLCCPEAILGGLADDADDPREIALGVADGELDGVLAPLSSHSVTTIVGFTECGVDGELYNAAAVYSRGAILGVYRKRHPARRASVYRAGWESPVWRADGPPFGVMICNDTNDPSLAARMVADGARILFVPSNNALPPERADVVAETRAVDCERAQDNAVAVVRADVAGTDRGRVSLGASAIVSASGMVLEQGQRGEAHLLMADLV